MYIFRLDFQQNPPTLPTHPIQPRRNLGPVQQRAMPIPLPTETAAAVGPQQMAALLGNQQIQAPQMGGQQHQQGPIPVMAAHQVGQPSAAVVGAPLQQQQPQGQLGAVGGQQPHAANAGQGEVYTMADLHNMAITQGRRLRFRRRRGADVFKPERH